MRHMWTISFWIVITSLGAQRWSILPWGTPVKIDFTREKTTLPTSKCSLIVVPKVFRTTTTILAWLRTESLRATKNKRLFNFAWREMLSRNNRPFLDTFGFDWIIFIDSFTVIAFSCSEKYLRRTWHQQRLRAQLYFSSGKITTNRRYLCIRSGQVQTPSLSLSEWDSVL